MGGVQVIFLPLRVFAPLTYVSSAQINCVVPYEVAGVANLQVEVLYLGQTSNAFVLQTTTATPGLFTQTGSGTGSGAVEQYDPQGNYHGVNSTSNPASPGWILTVYGTGEGQTSPQGVTGRVISSANVFPVLNPMTATIDGLPANVTYSAEAYGLVSGVWQVNVQVPPGVHTGIPVNISLTLGGKNSQAGVTVALK
jgi:uncharacterized protein (TIGR03437 family)